MANKVVNGSDLLLTMDGVVVAHAKSHTITITAEVRDKTSKSSGGWKEKGYGRFDWTAKIDGLVSFDPAICNYNTLLTALLAKEEVSIMSIDNTGGTVVAGVVTPLSGASVLSGKAIITSVEKTGGDNDNVTFSCSFDGSGAIEPVSAMAVTVGAGDIASTTATLVGTVCSNGDDSASISFQYGEDESLGETGTSVPASTTSAVPITAVSEITGLTTATKYFYRIKTVTDGVTRYGATRSFTTL